MSSRGIIELCIGTLGSTLLTFIAEMASSTIIIESLCVFCKMGSLLRITPLVIYLAPIPVKFLAF